MISSITTDFLLFYQLSDHPPSISKYHCSYITDALYLNDYKGVHLLIWKCFNMLHISHSLPSPSRIMFDDIGGGIFETSLPNPHANHILLSQACFFSVSVGERLCLRPTMNLRSEIVSLALSVWISISTLHFLRNLIPNQTGAQFTSDANDPFVETVPNSQNTVSINRPNELLE